MNELFKNGDYVLLEDCKAFDKKFGLEEGTTMWAIARKMEGGEPRRRYMLPYNYDKCVGVNDGDAGLWRWLAEEDYTTKLSVEEVLYRSKDGLTLDELSKIHGAYEEGKRYECVVGTNAIFNEGSIYKANGEGIKDEYSFSTGGHTAKFRPVTNKAEWIPSVGDEVVVHNNNDFELSYGKECLGKKVTVMSIFKDGEVTVAAINYEDINYCFVLSMLKPIDQKRERIVRCCCDVLCNWDKSTWDNIGKLYDAGMLKEGD